jgi:EAL domain-containing protein (putative c-di-GMP-specific phosphodiesterase class I)/DNA-binding CsgD family transcriptional regulator
MRVLVFDDDDAIGRLVVRVATMSGMDATAVTGADAFAEHLRQDPPQVVVLDLQLQGTDGVEQMRLLADRHYAGALVLMSGYDPRVLASAHAVGQNLGLKVERVLEKPLRIEDLEQVFQRLQSAERSLTAERLLEAISENELALDFQPIVTRQPKALKTLETLVRWEHPVLGRIPPADFMPIAESNVTITDALIDWVVGAAMEAHQVLAELGLQVPLSVNVSTQNLHDLTLPDRLEQRLRAGGMPPDHLCLEITESAAFKDTGRTMDILSRIRLKGMHLSIDEFGNGASSFAMLRQMPFSEIKIDRSFIADVTASRGSRAIVKSIIDLAAGLDMNCVAVGVETAAIADTIEQMGPCCLQGFFIARPMPVEAVLPWVATGMWSDPQGVGEIQVAAAKRGQGEVSPVPSAPVSSAPVSSPPVSSPPSAAKSGGEVVRLSPRQIEVMQLLSEGCAVKEIAYRLNIGISTVKVHLSLAYSALQSRNRIDAIRRAAPMLVSR